MTIPTFAPNPAPSPGTGFKPAVRLLVADFGDGYTQAAPDGLNHVKLILSLKWDGLTVDQAATIYGFFVERGGYLPFLYTPVGKAEPVRFTCSTFSKSATVPWSISAELAQDFGNAT